MRGAATDNGHSFANWDDAERISPSINLQLGVHQKRFASPRRVQSRLKYQKVSNLLGVRRCVKHFSVPLEPLWFFLIRLNQSNSLAISRKVCKQCIQAALD